MSETDPAIPDMPSTAVFLTVEIVGNFVAKNALPVSDLPKLITSVHAAIVGLGQPAPVAAEPAATKATPDEIRKSITPDHLVSFEDGKPYKTLRRHLTPRGLSPEQYRAKWGLPPDYPMTSANYSEQRSALAKALGLGRVDRAPAPATVQ